MDKYGAQFQEFVNLAARNAGDPNTIVCLDDREQGRAPDQLLGPNGEARLISVKTGDTIKPLLGARFGRSADNKALNNQIRNLFLETVLKVCGVQTKEQLPEAIRKAMKINDYDNKGHPLTVRRITAVKAAIEAKLNADAAVALREIKTMLNKQVVEGGNANEDECAARAQTLMDATKGDAELLNLLTKKDCALAREIMCKGSKGEILCSDALSRPRISNPTSNYATATQGRNGQGRNDQGTPDCAGGVGIGPLFRTTATSR